MTLCPNTRCWLISIFYIACLQFQFSKTMNFLLAAHYMLCKHLILKSFVGRQIFFKNNIPVSTQNCKNPPQNERRTCLPPLFFFVLGIFYDAFLLSKWLFQCIFSSEINLRSILLNNFMNEIKFTITYCVPFREPRLIQVSYFKSYHHVFIRNFFVHCF